MATKINITYYGTPENWTSISAFNNHAKWAQYRFGALIADGKWHISAGDMPDRSIVPWGMPHCSISSMAYTISCRDGGRYKKIIHENDSGNTPIMFAGNYGGISYSAFSGATGTDARNRQKNRIVGETNFNNDNLIYTNTADNGTIPDPTQSGVQGYAMTYIDYQHIRTVMRSVRLGDFASNDAQMPVKDVNFNVLKNQTDASGEDWQLLSISPTIAIDDNLTAGSQICPTICAAITAPPHLANRYFDDEDTKMMNIYRRIFVPGCLETRLLTSLSSLPAYNDIISGAKTASFPVNNIATQYQNISARKQVFDDVSYHWDIHIRYGTDSAVTFYDDGDELPASNSNISIINHLVIDDSIYNSKFEALYHACLHELAFLGLPIVEVAGDLPASIGSNDVYLPIFDTEHMITTGNYTTGADSMRYINAYWGDIFADTVPDWDPEYNPPDPEPEEGDSGDLTNRIPNRFAVGGLGLYVTNYQIIYSLQQFLNGTYAPTAEALAADFKGTNPQDYIISVQKYPSDALLPTSANQSDILIGKIDSTFDAYTLNDPQGSALGHYSFGQLTVGSGQIPIFGDFRDYQSKIILLMPFVGTAELDPRLYVGHSIGLDYVIDYLTGSVAAEIKRDGLTVETKTSKLSITVPFLAGNMGQYQNQLAQLEMSIEQSKIKQISGAVTTLFGVGGAAATVAGGGSELAGLGSGAGIIRGASNLLLERINQESLEYQVEHTQPSVGTISTASPGNSFEMDDRARLLIWRPYMLPGYDEAIYAHVVGHATLRAAQLSSFSGLTVAASAELSNIYTIDGTKAATEQELQMIKRALLTGVYV